MIKKVLIFSVDYYPYVGGAEIAIREICKRLPDKKYNLVTCWNNRKLPREELIDNIRVFRVGFGVRKIDKYFFHIFGLFFALKLARKNHYDVVWGMLANTAGLAAVFFKMLNPQIFYLLTLQEGDTESEHFWRTIFWRPLYKLIYMKADMIQAISNYLKERAGELGYIGPMAVIPNGVDIKKFSAEIDVNKLKILKQNLNLENRTVIISTSRLAKKNGLEDLIRSIKIIVEDNIPVKLLIIGCGEQEERLKKMTNILKLNHVIDFLGHLSHDNLPLHLKLSDIFVRPSLGEGLGNSFLEAMAAGVPIIGTMVGGIRDFLINEETGLVCEACNPKSVASCIKKIINDSDLRNKIVKNAQMVIKNHYDWDLIVSKLRAEVFYEKK